MNFIKKQCIQPMSIIPCSPMKFTLNDWYLNNRHRFRRSEQEQSLAERIIAECERTRDETAELTKAGREEIDHLIEEKLNDINYIKSELIRIRKEACYKLDTLVTYKERISDELMSIERAKVHIQKCQILRENRLGIDLVHDYVDVELLKEYEVVDAVLSLLKRTLQQMTEQIRRLKSEIYFLDRNLEDKDNALKIDGHNSSLKETSINLSIYLGKEPLDISNVTANEWIEHSNKSIITSCKEVNSGLALCSYIDTLLKQVTEDLQVQYDAVNNAFTKRISEVKEAKTKMELHHSEIVRQVYAMTCNITHLEMAIAEKEKFIALAHTRLGNRAQRSGIELVCDIVELKLVQEIQQIQERVAKLQLMLSEAQASMRYLLKTQIQLEEDINIKINTLKIDEVDCMTIRQSIDYHSY